MKRGTPEHPKARALARILRINHAWSVGILEMLWHFTAAYCPAGDVGRYSDEEIAEACAWPTDRPAGELIDALVTCRWLDRDERHRLVVHDWHEHADDYVHFRLAKARQRFTNGTMPRLDGLSSTERQRAREAYSSGGDEYPPSSRDESTRHATACHGTPRHATASRGTPRNAVAVSRSRSRAVAVPLPEPLPAEAPSESSSEQLSGNGRPACTSKNGGNGLEGYREAVEQTIRRVVGRSPRNGTASELIRRAAEMGVHPRYLVAWIAERRGAPKSDGLFRAAIADLPGWVRQNHCHDPTWDLRESVACQRCGGAMYVFRDAVIPCSCGG